MEERARDARTVSAKEWKHRNIVERYWPGRAKNLQEEIFNPFVTTRRPAWAWLLSFRGSSTPSWFIRVETVRGRAVFTLFFPLEEAAEARQAHTGTTVSDYE